ncbi:MAG: hypothetical protein AAFX81_05055 [Pseudomonadota bacterium]
MIRRHALALAAACLLAGTTLAADAVVGRWVLDDDALRERLRALFEAQLVQLSAEQQAMARGMLEAQLESTLSDLTGSSLVLDEDGTATLEPATMPPQPGRWQRDGDRITVTPDAPDAGTVALDGTLRDDRLELRPQDPDAPMVFVFRRSTD